MKGRALKERVVIVPAAGFGTRVGQPMSKEMLIRPNTCRLSPGVPMIQLSLELSQQASARAHIVTRKEKFNLNDYLSSVSKEYLLSSQIIEPTQEWPDTILRSKLHWGECNLVCLPDTDFSPKIVVEKMFGLLSEDSCDIVFATFEVADGRPWGVIRKLSQGGEMIYEHCEKPVNCNGKMQAWGLFGFKREFGEALLDQMSASTLDHRWRDISGRVQVLELNFFTDLTRGNSL